MLKVQKCINENIQYFKWFNPSNWEEVCNKVFITAINNADGTYDDITPYIKKLARTVSKEASKESPFDTVNEDGGVNFPFIQLQESADYSDLYVDEKAIRTEFKRLFLMYPKDFCKLRNVFMAEEAKELRPNVITNKEIKESVFDLRDKYGVGIVFSLLNEFFDKLPEYTTKFENTSIRMVEMKQKEVNLEESFSEIPLIKDKKGNFYSIDRLNLSMEKDPDTFIWDVIVKTTCDVLKIDITPLIDYMYNQIYLPKGVFSHHLEWCDDMYKLVTPAGKCFVNLDREKFLAQVRVELIHNLIANKFARIVALSPDSVYIKPARTLNCDTIRLRLSCGKYIDLPVTVHILK